MPSLERSIAQQFAGVSQAEVNKGVVRPYLLRITEHIDSEGRMARQR